MAREIQEFFVRVRFPQPVDGRKGCAVIVGAPSVKRAKELALLQQPTGSKILDIWKPAEEADGA